MTIYLRRFDSNFIREQSLLFHCSASRIRIYRRSKEISYFCLAVRDLRVDENVFSSIVEKNYEIDSSGSQSVRDGARVRYLDDDRCVSYTESPLERPGNSRADHPKLSTRGTIDLARKNIDERAIVPGNVISRVRAIQRRSLNARDRSVRS